MNLQREFGLTLVVCTLILCALPNLAEAQYRRRQESDSSPSLGTCLAVIGAGAFVGLILISTRPPGKEIDLRNERGVDLGEQLKEFDDPVYVDCSEEEDIFGLIRHSDRLGLTVATETGSTRVYFANVEKIKDLNTEAKRKEIGRLAMGITYTGLALSWLIYATAEDQSGLQTIGWSQFALFGALGVYTMSRPSKLEREAKRWRGLTDTEMRIGLYLFDTQGDRRRSFPSIGLLVSVDLP